MNAQETALAVMSTLQRLKAPAELVRGELTLSNFNLIVAPLDAVRAQKILGMGDDLSIVMGRSVIVRMDLGRLVIAVPRTKREFIGLESLKMRNMPVVGVYEDMQPVEIDFTNPLTAHAGVFGSTGSGKTVLIKTLLKSMSRTNKPNMILIDPKNSLHVGLEPHMQGRMAANLAGTSTEAENALKFAVAVMESRQDMDGNDKLVVVIDEATDMCQQNANIAPLIQRIAQRGRSVGVHMIVGTQKPLNAALSSLILANIPLRYVGKTVDAKDAALASGLPRTGAEKLLGLGDFLEVGGNGSARRLQVAQ